MRFKIRNNLLYSVNKLLCLVLCIWIIWPYANYKLGAVFGIIISILWFFTTGYFILLKKWSRDLFFVIMFFLTLIPYIITGTFKYSSIDPIYILATFYFFLIGIFISHYYIFYKKDYAFLGKIGLTSLFAYFIGSIQTYYGLTLYPMASRILATGADPEILNPYLNIGIGGFGFIYSACFMVIIMLYLIFKKSLKINLRILFLLFLIVMIFTITKASYAIAVIIMSIGIFSALIIKKKKYFIFLPMFLIIFFLIIPQSTIGNFLLTIANLFNEDNILREKLTDLSQFLLKSGGEQMSNRLELYLISLRTFFNWPIFGIYGHTGTAISRYTGEHSGWLDLMAYYGIFTSFPLFAAIFLNFKKILKFFKFSSSYKYILIIQILFLLFGIINPILYIYQIGFAIFLIIPSIPFLPYFLKPEKYINKQI